ncbi:glycosyltransferase family 2 protein [Nonlabens antarcticus]|uniref:glycosyltransferase family 2 protein n=1 Tax=Nonlabens antarcticus TaxID=392714 RepID=UPI001891201B|nr:glycosyltransferase [Nonlabens antarcticus]
MIILEHHNGRITSDNGTKNTVVAQLYDLARKQPDTEFVIHRTGLDPTVFIETIKAKKGKNVLISTTTDLNSDFGYVEDSPFIKINPNVIYPTWKKSTSFFYMHAALINQLSDKFPETGNLLYWINSVAKILRPQGVLCYQIPTHNTLEKLTTSEVYRFVAQHYKRRWTLVLLLSHIIYEHRLPLFAFVNAQFFKKRNWCFTIQCLQKDSKQKAYIDNPYDVIIPTMGRPEYLKNVLKDFAKQTCRPEMIVIIEQNADPQSKSDLGFLQEQDWPFEIKHKFIHKTGVCNARNIAISHTSALWVMFFDDDARFDSNIFERIFETLKITSAKVLNTAYLQKDDREHQKTYKQWESFGSGCSMVHREVFSKCRFDSALEHGYGEDVDYGMQIRNAGYDIIYAPQIHIAHLKAPIGGFRTPHVFEWNKEKMPPKPAPQIMYFRQKHTTLQQMLGYKLSFGMKLYPALGSKNPWKHYVNFKKAWALSLKYAAKL